MIVAPVGTRVPDAVADLDPRPAELLDPAVLPDPGAVVEGAVAVRGLLDDDARRRSPRTASARRATTCPRTPGRPACPAGRRLADRADAPRPVPGADPAVRRRRRCRRRRPRSCPPRCRPARTAARRGSCRRALTHHVRQLLDDVERALPGQVQGDALGLLHHHAAACAAARRSRSGSCRPAAPSGRAPRGSAASLEVHGGLLVAAAQQHEGVLGAEVRVEAEPGDEEQVAGAVVRVEVAAVVEVAVAAARPGDRARAAGGSGTRRAGRDRRTRRGRSLMRRPRRAAARTAAGGA